MGYSTQTSETARPRTGGSFDWLEGDVTEATNLLRNATASSPKTGLTVGFAVTTTDMGHGAGDLYTAMGLGQALQQLWGWEVRYLDKGRWRDAAGLDLYIAMRDRIDISALENAAPGLVTVAWMRSWLERWTERPWINRFDVHLASSTLGANYFRDRTGRDVAVLPIAASLERFTLGPARPELAADYVFTGNYWGATPPREIEAFAPSALPYSFGLYGKNWETHPRLSGWARGFAPYESLSAIYNSANVTLDDTVVQANKPWGSVNSRVFEALAAGSLVMTNDALGSSELFGGRVPVWRDLDELAELLRFYLDDADARAAKVAALRQEVVTLHSYEARARRLHEILGL